MSQLWRPSRTGAEEIYGLGELSQYEQEGLKVRSYSLFDVASGVSCELEIPASCVHTDSCEAAVFAAPQTLIPELKSSIDKGVEFANQS